MKDCRRCSSFCRDSILSQKRVGDELSEGLSGVVSLSEGKAITVHGSRAPPIPHYDGVAAWDLVDMERYRAVWLKATDISV